MKAIVFIPMKVTVFLVLAYCLPSMIGFANAFASEDLVNFYQKLVKQWLTLEAQEKAMLEDWRSHKPLFEQRIALLQQEADLHKQKLQESAVNKDKITEKREQLLSRQAELERSQQQLSLWLSQKLKGVEEEMHALAPPLRASWEAELLRLHSETNNTEKLEIILTLYRKKAEFNSIVTSVKTKIVIADGSERLVEQLYLGATLGYYVTPDGEQVGIGTQTPEGWQWRQSESLSAAKFRRAQAMLNKQQSAALMELPVVLSQKPVSPSP